MNEYKRALIYQYVCFSLLNIVYICFVLKSDEVKMIKAVYCFQCIFLSWAISIALLKVSSVKFYSIRTQKINTKTIGMYVMIHSYITDTEQIIVITNGILNSINTWFLYPTQNRQMPSQSEIVSKYDIVDDENDVEN